MNTMCTVVLSMLIRMLIIYSYIFTPRTPRVSVRIDVLGGGSQ